MVIRPVPPLRLLPILAIVLGLVSSAGGTQGYSLSLERMIQVALRRGSVSPAYWLTPLYFGLGLAGLGIEVFLYGKLFALRGRGAVLHVLSSAIALTVLASVCGAVMGIPLRYFFE